MAENKPVGGTSVFDPVLCEILYNWFCPPAGLVLDPFAGGSVRGIVAAKLGRRYYGLDLRPEQVEANEAQAIKLCPENRPVWKAGDAKDIDTILGGIKADFLFTCPPYVNLEVYSDDARDLSTMKYPQFCESYYSIITKTADMLKDDRFACIVVGEVRNPQGNYYGFVPETIRTFEAAGLKYYNEAILITQVGSLPIRAGRPFSSSRKLGKTHQIILVFVKGDAARATQAIGPVRCGDLTKGSLPS